MPRGDRYEFGSWRLEVGNVLSRAGRTVHLAPKEMATLQTLVENSGRVISTDDLMSEVWPAGASADSSLSRCIYILRKILGGGRALALDPNLASAHAALGWLASMFDGDMAAAEASFARALSLDPGAADAHGSYSIHLLASGRLEESLQEIQAELELDPRSQVTYASRAWVLFCSRRFDEALAEARRAIEIDPGYAASHSFLGAIAGHEGAFDEALIAGGKAAALTGDFSTWGYVCARAGRRDEAKLVLERAAREGDNHATPSRLAAIALALEERDSALGWLERALERRCIWLRLSLADPRLDPLRDEPRFRAIVGRVSKARIATPPALGRRGGRSL